MSIRRWFTQATSFKGRLKHAENLQKQAQGIPPGVGRDERLRKARQAELAASVDDGPETTGLQLRK